MIRILSTLLRADGGRARVAGFDIAAQRHQYHQADQPHRAVRGAGRAADRESVQPPEARARAGQRHGQVDQESANRGGAKFTVTIGETTYVSPEIGESVSTAFYATMQKLATQVVDMMEQPW